MDNPTLRWRVVSRIVDLIGDGLVVALLLTGVGVGVLPHEMGIATLGYALKSLVHPSLGIGIFTRPVEGD